MAKWWEEGELTGQAAADYAEAVAAGTISFSDEGVPLSGTPRSVMMTLSAQQMGRTYQGARSFAQDQAVLESDRYKEFVAGLQASVRGRKALATFGPWELFNMKRGPAGETFIEDVMAPITGGPSAAPETEETDTSSGQFGDWIGTEDMIHTGDFVDTDGDGIDDRWQSGPGQPSSRTAVDPTKPTLPDEKGFLDFEEDSDVPADPTASLGDFVTTLENIGIDRDLALELWDWGQEKLLDDTYPIENIAIDVYDQEAFKQRFPAIEMMRGRKDVRPVTPKEYLVFEEDVKELLTRYSVGGQNINFDSLVTNLLTNTVGTGEVEQRLVAAKRVLGNVPEPVKQTYMQWYGPEVAEENLMKTFLDPGDEWGGAWADVEAEVATAEVGGWARVRLGLDQPQGITQSTAARISALGLSQQNIWQRLDQLKAQEDLFTEKLGEEDITIQGVGVESAFDLEDDASDLLERRSRTRVAEFAGGGGAMVSGATTGFGAANA